MKRGWMITVALGLTALAVAATGLAAVPGKGKPPNPNGTYGPYAVTTTDHGCSGAAWASDKVKRRFKVEKIRAHTFRVWRYDRGTFETLGGTSPGNCTANKGPHGKTVTAGVKGKVHGFLVGTVTGTYNPKATCAGDCGATDVFIATFFGSDAVFACSTNSKNCRFFFQYDAAGQGLKYHHWTDSGTGAGTLLKERFHGDIAKS